MEQVYACPMLPEVVSDKPGKCPTGGMNLVSKKADQVETKRPEKKGSRHINTEQMENTARVTEHQYYQEHWKPKCSVGILNESYGRWQKALRVISYGVNTP
jgi:hypothetical protein